MKQVLLSLCCLVISTIATAQFEYDFSAYKAAYTPLTGATSLVDTNTWDDEIIKIPIGFNFRMNGVRTDSFSLSAFQMFGMDTFDLTSARLPNNYFSGFLFMNADVHDRADTGTTMVKGVSPVHYKVDGAAPGRIFKFEMFNAGFADEYPTYGTNNDSLNLQIWLYEGSNDIEFRFGSSNINNDYFNLMGYVPFAYFDKLSPQGTFTEFYYLSGNPSNPVIDSADDIDDMGVLDAYPDSGTVYRFAAKPLSVNTVTGISEFVSIYPTISYGKLHVKNDSHENLYYSIISVSGAATRCHGRLNNMTTTSLDISNLQPGNYIIQLNSNTGRSGIMFVKL